MLSFDRHLDMAGTTLLAESRMSSGFISSSWHKRVCDCHNSEKTHTIVTHGFSTRSEDRVRARSDGPCSLGLLRSGGESDGQDTGFGQDATSPNTEDGQPYELIEMEKLQLDSQNHCCEHLRDREELLGKPGNLLV